MIKALKLPCEEVTYKMMQHCDFREASAGGELPRINETLYMTSKAN